MCGPEPTQTGRAFGLDDPTGRRTLGASQDGRACGKVPDTAGDDTPCLHEFHQYKLLDDDAAVYYWGWTCTDCGAIGYEVPDDED